jgi:hypothetical protein
MSKCAAVARDWKIGVDGLEILTNATDVGPQPHTERANRQLHTGRVELRKRLEGPHQMFGVINPARSMNCNV